jgi:hypothetical protein
MTYILSISFLTIGLLEFARWVDGGAGSVLALALCFAYPSICGFFIRRDS